jgi:hypothetical protein
MERWIVLAYDYPLMGVFWTMLWFFVWFVWILALFRVIIDIFRSHDMGGVAKAVWLIFVLFLPFLGVFIYLIARGSKMAQRDAEQAQANDAAFKDYVRQAASSSGGGTADELSKLADLKEKGVITDAEFAQQKAKILG